MAFTSICVATSFDPATTRAFPFAAINSFAAIATAASAALLAVLFPERDLPEIALYKLINNGPSSDGLIGMRASALVPVTLIAVSNWIWRDIFLACNDLLLRF